MTSTSFQLDAAILSAASAKNANPLSIIYPLMEHVAESRSLIQGYGGGQMAIRSELIPYFHLIGKDSNQPLFRALIVSGILGTESTAALSVSRLLVTLEARLRAISGIELTAYPALNVEASLQNTALTGKQQLEGVQLWKQSPCTHVRVLEAELVRYPYDLAVAVRESETSDHLEVSIWPSSYGASHIFGEAMQRLSTYAGDRLRWKMNPGTGRFARTLTPIPGASRQPSEVIVSLPVSSTPDRKQLSEEALGLVLTLLHAGRQARREAII